MNQKNLVSLIVLDVIVLFFAVGLFLVRYRWLNSGALQSLSELSRAAAPRANNQAAPAQKPEAAPARTAQPGMRNIGFSYKNSKVKKVELIGSFNNWIPQPLTKAENNTWKISVSLPPGDYAYNFVADGRPVRDPYNQKVCNAGRGFVNSYLKVKPLNEENR
jgi:hypothetical protein